MAPLKRRYRRCRQYQWAQLPRLQKRGPIEAATCLRENVPTSLFPRLQKRGPIEAFNRADLATALDRSFHAYKSVAPLKLSTAPI